MDNINFQTKKYFIYTRKSTDKLERRMLSIEAQMFELREYAKNCHFQTYNIFEFVGYLLQIIRLNLDLS